jgi:hypothetical protein
VGGTTLLFSGPDKVAFIIIHMGSDILKPFTKVIQTSICLVTHKYYKHTHTYTNTVDTVRVFVLGVIIS